MRLQLYERKETAALTPEEKEKYTEMFDKLIDEIRKVNEEIDRLKQDKKEKIEIIKGINEKGLIEKLARLTQKISHLQEIIGRLKADKEKNDSAIKRIDNEMKEITEHDREINRLLAEPWRGL